MSKLFKKTPLKILTTLTDKWITKRGFFKELDYYNQFYRVKFLVEKGCIEHDSNSIRLTEKGARLKYKMTEIEEMLE